METIFLKLRRMAILSMLLMVHAAQAAISVRDDGGHVVLLPKIAQRIVSLAPHVTELLFAAGAGDRIVGAIGYSDYPPAAKKIPRVGDDAQIDLERVLALKPDLLVVWLSGNTERQLVKLRELGIPLFYSEPRVLEDIPGSLLRLGQLMGTEKQAQQAAADLYRQISTLKGQFRGRPPVRVFYQVWDNPLFTLNGKHIVSDAIRLCGGDNIFAQMTVAAPNVSVEAVLQADPEALFSGDQSNPDGRGLNQWRAYPTLTAVRRGNLFSLDGNLLSRAGPRMIAGTAALCEKIEQARQHRQGR